MRTMRNTLFVVLASIVAFVSLTESTFAGDFASSAKRYLHMSERANTRALAKILGVNPRKTPWCGAFVAHIAKTSGRRVPRSPNLARSWTKYGKRVTKPRRGDIVVLRSKRGYHVSIVDSVSGKWLMAVGGNQRNRVQVSRYSLRAVVAFRR